MGRADGVTDTELDALADFEHSPLFNHRDRAALRYANTIVREQSVPDEVFAPIRQHFTQEEIIELTATITWEICAAKFNRALKIEAQGVCRVATPTTP